MNLPVASHKKGEATEEVQESNFKIQEPFIVVLHPEVLLESYLFYPPNPPRGGEAGLSLISSRPHAVAEALAQAPE